MTKQELLTKILAKSKKERVWRYGLIIYAALLCIISAILLSDYSDDKMAIVIFTATPLLVGIYIYFLVHFPCLRASKFLFSKSSEIQDDISNGNFLISVAPLIAIPYSQIAWVYIDRNDPCFIQICCKNGQHYKIEDVYHYESEYEEKAEDELDRLSEIAEIIPHALLGNTKENKRLYLEKYPAARSARNKKYTFWGIVILCLSALFTVMSILNGAIEFLGVILILALAVFGILLLIKAKKTE